MLVALIVIGSIAAVASAFRRPDTGEIPGRLVRACAGGLLGALLGCLLVGDPTLGWGIHGVFPALALLPSLIGGFWSGYHLWRFADEVPRGLRGVPLSRGIDITATGPAMNVVAGAVARLVGATLLLSLVVMGRGRWTSGYDKPTLFGAFGAATLITRFVGLFESLGYVRWALLSAMAGFAAELGVTQVLDLRLAGGGLLIGGLVGSLVASGQLLRALNRPGRTLATALWVR